MPYGVPGHYGPSPAATSESSVHFTPLIDSFSEAGTTPRTSGPPPPVSTSSTTYNPEDDPDPATRPPFASPILPRPFLAREHLDHAPDGPRCPCDANREPVAPPARSLRDSWYETVATGYGREAPTNVTVIEDSNRPYLTRITFDKVRQFIGKLQNYYSRTANHRAHIIEMVAPAQVQNLEGIWIRVAQDPTSRLMSFRQWAQLPSTEHALRLSVFNDFYTFAYRDEIFNARTQCVASHLRSVAAFEDHISVVFDYIFQSRPHFPTANHEQRFFLRTLKTNNRDFYDSVEAWMDHHPSAEHLRRYGTLRQYCDTLLERFQQYIRVQNFHGRQYSHDNGSNNSKNKQHGHNKSSKQQPQHNGRSSSGSHRRHSQNRQARVQQYSQQQQQQFYSSSRPDDDSASQSSNHSRSSQGSRQSNYSNRSGSSNHSSHSNRSNGTGHSGTSNSFSSSSASAEFHQPAAKHRSRDEQQDRSVRFKKDQPQATDNRKRSNPDQKDRSKSPNSRSSSHKSSKPDRA